MNLTGKRVLVTGSTMGIGFAVAEGMHKQGAKVAINGRDEKRVRDAINKLGGGDRLCAVIGDVSSLESCKKIIEATVSQLGGIDCLVNNAGIGELSYLEDISEEHFLRIVNTNLRSAFFMTQYALPELKRSKGNVIFTSSSTSFSAGPTDSVVYAAAKSGMNALAQSLALELAPSGVRINVVSPGYTDTPLIAEENKACDGQVYEFINKCVPLARIGTMEEVASTFVYMASDDAEYFTGAVIANDGGICSTRNWGGRN